MALAGSLEIELAAGVARLSQDMAAARSIMGGALSDIDRMVSTTKKGLAALGVGFSVAAIAEFLKGVNDATSKMKDLGKEAGTTAEAISRFELPARAAGSSLDDVAGAIFRLSKAAVEARDPSSKAAAALASIGLSAKDLKGLKSDEMFELIARRLAEYNDGMQKNAVMQALFNKSGKDMNKVVSEIAESGHLAATVTNEQAEQANLLNKQVIELKIQSEQFWRNLISQGVPALNDILKAFNDSRREVGLWQASIDAASVAWEKLLGSPLDQQKKELSALELQIKSVQEHMAGGPGFLETDAQTTKYAEHLNELLARRGQLEAMIFNQELQAQDARAIAGQRAAAAGGKGDPNYDPNAAARANAFKTELENLDQEMAKLKGVGELEAYVKKLEEDRFKLLTPAQKQLLADKEKEYLAYKKLIETNQLLLQSDTQLLEAQQRLRDLEQQARDASKDSIEALQFEVDLMTKSAQLQEKLRAMHEIDLDLKRQIAQIDQGDGDQLSAEQLIEIDKLRKIAELRKAGIGELIDQKHALADNLTIWNSAGDAAGKFFGDLLEGGKTAFDNLKNWAKQFFEEMISIFAKRWLLQVAASATGSTSLAGAAAQTGANSAANLAGSAIMNYAGGALGITGAGGFMTGFSAGAAGIGGVEGLGVAGTVGEGLGVAYGAVTDVLAAMGPVGWVALAALAAYAIFGGKGGGPKGGGSFAGNFDGTGQFTGAGLAAGTQNGRLFTPATDDASMQSLVTSLGQSFAQGLAALGGTSNGVTFGLGYDTDPHGRAGDRVSSVVSGPAGNILYQNINQDTGASLQGTLSLEAQRMLLAALQASTLPKQVADILNSVVAAGASAEDIQKVIAAATEMAGVIKALPTLGLHIDIAGLQAMAMAGESIGQTFTRLATTMAQFDDAFMSDAQKLAKAQKDVADGFKALGIAIPVDKNAFMDLVHGLDLTTEAGRAMFNALMALAPAFLLTANAANQATTAQDPNALPPGYSWTQFDQDGYVTALQQAADAARQLGEQLFAAKNGLKDYVNGLLLNPQLSPLSLADRFAEAQRQYNQVRDASKGTGADALAAIGQLPGVSSTYLDLARQLFAGADYNAIYRSVVGEVGGIAGISQQELNDRLNGALPKDSTMMSSGDGAKIEGAVYKLINLIANGLTVNDPATQEAIGELKTEVETASRSGSLLG